MSDKSKIEWTDATWNPLRGCSKVSEGCRNCYAAGVAARFSGPGMAYEGLAKQTSHGPEWTGVIKLVPEALEQPLKWKRPRRIFVNSMSDLFHKGVPFDYIDRVFAVMALAPQHTFQILTKRPERMREYVNTPDRDEKIGWQAHEIYEETGKGDYALIPSLTTRAGIISDISFLEHPNAWPLPNVWLGTSVENQQAADERIPHLLQTPAAVRFLSCEPLLGPVNLRNMDVESAGCNEWCFIDALAGKQNDMGRPCECVPKIDWVIVGGESGHKARPMHPDWLSSLRDQCVSAGVAFHFKQWGEWIDWNEWIDMPISESQKYMHTEFNSIKMDAFNQMVRVGKKAAGRLLDGREWNEFPEVPHG